MVERAPLARHRAGSYELRRREERDLDREHSVPLFISDSDGEPDPSEYITPLRTGRRASLSSRILAVVCAAAAVAVLFALFSSDAMRDLVNVKASMVSLFPAPSAAASSSPLPAAAPSKDPVRVALPENQRPDVRPMTMASVTPSREEMKSAYQSALQDQAPIAAPVPAPAPPVSAIHHLDPDEIVASLKRAGTLIASGDIAAARLVLRPVAEDGDAQASVMLAEVLRSGDPE